MKTYIVESPDVSIEKVRFRERAVTTMKLAVTFFRFCLSLQIVKKRDMKLFVGGENRGLAKIRIVPTI